MKLRSEQDPSVNFVEESLAGFVESRYVRKTRDYFICYLSSQSGCNQGCRFCHLTATKQTRYSNVTASEYVDQAFSVLKHYWNEHADNPAKYMHYNFMARGEALSNPHLLDGADKILYKLADLTFDTSHVLGVKYNVSTIMPRSFDMELSQVFRAIHPTIYYSYYSADKAFRSKWMPQAMPVPVAMRKLKAYQEFSKKVIKFHHCFIEGINDSLKDVDEMLSLIHYWDLDVEFNLVRYNPFSELQGRESSDEVIARNMGIINSALRGKGKIIPRVGFDVKASCGMFVDKSGKV